MAKLCTTIQTLHNSTKLYKTLENSTTLFFTTLLYNILQTFSTNDHTYLNFIQQNITKLYKTNSTALNKIAQKTLQNNKTTQNFTQTLQHLTQLYKTLQDFTKLNTTQHNSAAKKNNKQVKTTILQT